MRSVDVGWLVAVWLLSMRLGSMVLMSPPLGGGMVPPSVRVAIVLSWAAVLASGSAGVFAPDASAASSVGTWPTLGALVSMSAREVMLGALMALGLNLAFAVFSAGARLVDIQIGFGVGQVLDPLTRQQLPVLTAIATQTSVLGFFLLDGHHALLRGVSMSLEAIPPGQAWSLALALPALVRQAGEVFSLGFAMVAPVVFCLTLVELGIAVLSRNLPQVNALVLGIPIKVFVGLSVMALWATGSGHVMQRAYTSAFALWEASWR